MITPGLGSRSGEPWYRRRDIAGQTETQAPRRRAGRRRRTQRDHDALPGDLATVLVPLHRRALGDSAVHWALLAVAGWASAACFLLAWSKLRPTGDVAFIVAGLAAGAVLAACAAWVWRRPSLMEVARQADARLGLDERLATALCFGGASGEMEARLRADAAWAAQRHRPAEAFPLARHHKPAIAAAVAALVAIALAVTPNPQASTLAHRAADRAAVARARQVVARAQKQLRGLPSPEERQLSAALQRALSQLEKAGTPIASLVALSDLSRQLAALDNASASAQQAAEAAAGDALSGAPGAASVARDLSNGELSAAAAGLRKLANKLPELSPAERKALAAALAKAAAAAGSQADDNQAGSSPSGPTGAGGGQEFAAAIRKASAALGAGRVGAASQALDAAANGAVASQAAVSLQQELDAIQAAVQNEAAREAMEAQADIGAPGKTAGASGGASQPGLLGRASSSAIGAAGASAGHGSRLAGGVAKGGLGGGEGGAGFGGNGSGGGGTGGGATGEGARSSAATGAGGAGTGRAGAGGPNSTGQGGPGNGTAAARRTGPAGRASSGAAQVYVAGQPGKGEQVIGAQLGEGGRVKTTSYQAVLPRFAKTALQDLNSNVVSPDDRNLVRSYFSSLGNRK
jgi:hypothetical protein